MDLYRNQEGYLDPTAGEALLHTEWRKKAAKDHAYRPLTYIVSAYAGDITSNVVAARRYCRFAVDQGRIPICSHLLYPQFLHDDDPEERQLGLFFGKILMDRCEEVWIFTDGTYPPGMMEEWRRARWRRQKIRYFTTDCRVTDAAEPGGADGAI